jgi:alpha-galactosidase
MKNALASSGRAIVFSICAWSYQSWMPSTGNLWRTTGDINDSWGSMYGIPNTNNASASSAAPGAWNDPDMLEVGRGGMTDTEYHTHFGWWAIMAAPLIAGNDVRSQSAATTAILEAPEIIAVDQDSAGHQGTRVWDGGNGLNIWSKTQSGTNTRAVFVLNGSNSTASITISWSQIGLPAGNATVRDLWSRTDLGTFTSYTASNIPSHGSVMLKIVSGGSVPTNTPTRTPTVGASNTPNGPTSTPTRTLTPGGPTPTRTITPTPGSGSCTPVTATITAPFTQDGAGTFCWQSSNLGSYINSWNLVSLAVNGVNETNLYVASGSYPAKINGYWYVSYNSTVSWGHFEAK